VKARLSQEMVEAQIQRQRQRKIQYYPTSSLNNSTKELLVSLTFKVNTKRINF